MNLTTELSSTDIKGIWVLENFGETFEMNPVEVLYLRASVSQWKKLKPGIPCYLICTETVRTYLEGVGALSGFDGIDTQILASTDTVRRSPFWAAPKIKAMKSITAPFVMMDNDLFFENGTPLSQNETDLLNGSNSLVVSYLEDGYEHYISSDDALLATAGITDTYPPDYEAWAYNVSFLYIGDDGFKTSYANKAWDWMEKLSAVYQEPSIDKSTPKWKMTPSNLHGGYMVFAEQKLLFDMATEAGYSTKTLIPDTYNCKGEVFVTSSPEQASVQHLGRKKLLLVNAADVEKYTAIVTPFL
jgi:hypothetical protein